MVVARLVQTKKPKQTNGETVSREAVSLYVLTNNVCDQVSRQLESPWSCHCCDKNSDCFLVKHPSDRSVVSCPSGSNLRILNG